MKKSILLSSLFMLLTAWAIGQNVFFEGFESGNTNGSAIAGWTQASVTGTNVWTANNSLTTYNRSPRTGTWNAFLRYANTRWMFKQVTLTGGTNYRLSFYARQDVTSGCNILASYGTTGTIAGMTNAIIPSTAVTNGSYQSFSGTFTPSSSGTYYIGIRADLTYTPYYISIDDISLDVNSTPTLATVPGTINFGYVASGSTYEYPTPYVLSGINLTAGPVVVTAPSAAFEVSLTGGGVGFGPSVNVTYTPPTLSATNIYVRFKPTGPQANYSGNITNAGGGASTNVAVTGSSYLYTRYCASNATNTADEDIYNVTLGTLNNTSDCNTTAPGPGSSKNLYSNYTTTVAAPDLQQGSSNAFSVQVGTCGTGTFGNGVKIFIDFNQDGDFADPGEEVYATPATPWPSGAHTETGNIAVPGGAALGNTMMRVVNMETSAPGNILACGTYTYGETEDYLVNITVATTPTLNVSPGSLAFGYVPSGNTYEYPTPYVLSGTNLTAGPVVVTAPSADFEVSLTGGGVGFGPTVNVTYTPPTLSATNIYIRFKPTGPQANYSGNITNAGGSASTNVAVSGSSYLYTRYCASNATNTADEDIYNVTLGTLNNTSDCNTTAPGPGSSKNLYSNYTTTVAAPVLQQGSSNAFSVQVGTCGTGTYGNGVKIFIDFNQDGDFADPGEEVYATPATPWPSGAHTETGNIAVPGGAAVGNTMMRVVNMETSAPGNILACGTYSYGETEDYVVNISPPAPKALGTIVYNQASTANVATGSTGNPILRLDFPVTGSTGTLYLNSVSIASNNTDDNDISLVKLYRTTTPAFSTDNLLGSQTFSGGVAAFSSLGYDLPAGITYLWVTYDISGSATNLHIADAKIETGAIDVAGTTYPASEQSPAGSRTIRAPLAGTYYIGASKGDYSTLTAAVSDLNALGISASVMFLLTDATYSGSEIFPITINQVAGASPTKTVTIKPNAGVTADITGTVNSSAMIKVLSSYVIIDGSNSSGGTSRNLTITNNSTTSPNVLLIGSSGTTPVTGTTVKNSILVNGAASSTALVISDGTTLGNAGYFSNITVQNNSIQKAYIGIYAIATVATGNGNGLLVTGNDLSTSGSNAIANVGIYVQGVDGATIANNLIGNFETVTGQNDKGIWLATGTVNSVVNANKIDNIGYSGTSGYGASGIAVSTGTANANIILKNNFISHIFGDADSYTTYGGTYSPIGIYIFSAQTGIKVYFNSVNLYGNTLNYSSASASFGIFVGTTTYADIRDNIIVNNLGRSSTSGYGAVGVYAQTDKTQFNNIDYNDYYINPTGSGVKAIGQISTTASTTLDAWKLATSQDNYSISGDPKFVSNTDLHINIYSTSPVSNAGVSLAPLVTDDIDGNARQDPPDIGADEYIPACTTAAGGTAYGSTAFCVSGTPSIAATGYSTGPGSNYQWMYSTSSADYPGSGSPVVGQTNPASLTTGDVSVTTYYWLKVECATKASTAYSTMVTITIHPLPQGTLTANGPFCVTGAGQLTWTDQVKNGATTYTVVYNDGTDDRTVTGVYSGVPFDVYFTPVTANTTYTLVRVVNELTTCERTSGFNGPSATITVNPLPWVPGSPAVSVITPVSFDLSWTFDGGTTPDYYSIEVATDNLFNFPVAGSPFTVNYPATTFTVPGLSGSTTYFYRVQAINVCPSPYTTPGSVMTLCPAVTAPFTENFEAPVFAPACWANTAVGGPFLWTRSTAASAYGDGTASATANFYNQAAGTYELRTVAFDASGLATPTLRFNYAYATYVVEIDELDVYYSTNYGRTWQPLIYMPGGKTGILNTAGATEDSFVPTAAQWKLETLPLPAGTNMLRFTAISAYGNNLYLDNISVDDAVPSYYTVDGEEVHSGDDNCYDATNTLTLQNSEVRSGGSANFIAGVMIRILPEVHAANGSYMHCYISDTYCNGKKAPAIPEVVAAAETTPNSVEQAGFVLFPNPTTGDFTLMRKGEISGNVTVQIYTMRGDRVMTEQMAGEKSRRFTLSGMPDGLYFVKVETEGFVETIKVIKTR